jgi:hypothetical protein
MHLEFLEGQVFKDKLSFEKSSNALPTAAGLRAREIIFKRRVPPHYGLLETPASPSKACRRDGITRPLPESAARSLPEGLRPRTHDG